MQGGPPKAVEGAAACAILTSVPSIAISICRRSEYPNAVLPKPTISALVLSSPRFKVVSGTINLDDQARQCAVVISHNVKPPVGSRPLHRSAVPLPRASRGGGTYGNLPWHAYFI
jgi:hypothetical protein